jgi:hypothetical protein
MDEPNPLLWGFDLKTEDDRRRLRHLLDRTGALLDKVDNHAQEIGHLCITWASMDRMIDHLFRPLLGCSAEQVACILVENIDTRCTMLKRLLVVADVPTNWLEWIVALLNRASNELAPLRNRVVHDAWRISENKAMRIDKRAKIAKSQSRGKGQLSFDTEHPMEADEITLLDQKVSTVAIALRVAAIALDRWQIEGRFPELDPQWLPACKLAARCPDYQLDGESPEKPFAPLHFEFG